jgi:hypothetical protein
MYDGDSTTKCWARPIRPLDAWQAGPIEVQLFLRRDGLATRASNLVGHFLALALQWMW